MMLKVEALKAGCAFATAIDFINRNDYLSRLAYYRK